MRTVSSENASEGRRRRRVTATVKDLTRELRSQLAVLNHRIADCVNLKDVDLDCLDMIARHGPLSPSGVARRAGLHPATTTGVLDRLEAAGWVARERHPSDRRSVVVRAVPERARELIRMYAGMNTAVDRICGGYTMAELELLVEFLTKAADAGRTAAEELA